jgi:molybdate-binding protein/transcriptional regulator with XRE-family HTH domain
VGAVEAGRRLRLARLAAGLTQSQLADLCSVSRQAVAGAEAGVWSPSLAGALALARALGSTVDQLFAPDTRVQAVAAISLSPGNAPGRARLVRVFDRWIALPLIGDRAAAMGFASATGRLAGADSPAELWGSGRSLLVAGCDPALPLLGAPVAGAGDGWGLDWWACGNAEAARLLQEGLVHAASLHYPVAERARHLGDPALASIGFARWREGLLLRGDDHPLVNSVSDAVRERLRWVNREEGAQARRLLDAELGALSVAGLDLPGYRSEVGGHLQVASAVGTGLADVGIATEPAALTYGLRFLPLSEEECVVQVARERLESPELRLLLLVLGGPQLRRELLALPGYDPAILGEEL